MHVYLSIFTPGLSRKPFREDLPPTLFPLFLGEFPSLLGQLNLRWGGHFRDFMQVVENVRKVGENSARDQWSCSYSFIRIIACIFIGFYRYKYTHTYIYIYSIYKGRGLRFPGASSNLESLIYISIQKGWGGGDVNVL